MLQPLWVYILCHCTALPYGPTEVRSNLHIKDRKNICLTQALYIRGDVSSTYAARGRGLGAA